LVAVVRYLPAHGSDFRPPFPGCRSEDGPATRWKYRLPIVSIAGLYAPRTLQPDI
jgi:hypothetical protein